MLNVLLPIALAPPLAKGLKLPGLSRRGKLIALALAVAIPAICLAAFFSYLVGSVQVYGQVEDVELLGVEGGQLHLRAKALVSSNTPVGVDVTDVGMRLFWGDYELGEASLVGDLVRLEPGRATRVELDVRIWGLEALGGLLSEGLASGKAVVRAEASGTVRASFISFWVQRALEVEVPIPKLSEHIKVLELALTGGHRANATVSFRNPYDIMFEVCSLDLTLSQGGQVVGHAVLAEPVVIRPGCEVGLVLNISITPGSAQLIADALTDDWCLSGQVSGRAELSVSSLRLGVELSNIGFDLEAEPGLDARPLEVEVVNGDRFATSVLVNASLGPIKGPIHISSGTLEAYVGSEFLGTLYLNDQDIELGEQCLITAILDPALPGAQALIQEVLRSGVAELLVGNASLDLLVMGEEVHVLVGRSFSSLAEFSLSYELSISQVLSLVPERPGNVFIVDAEVHVSVVSPVLSPVEVEALSFDVFSPDERFLGTGSLEEPIELPTGNGDFYVEATTRLELTRDGVQWLAEQLVAEGSISLVLGDVVAIVGLGPLDVELGLEEFSYSYEPGEIEFEVEDVDLVSVSFEPPSVIFDVEVSIYNPLDFSVNLTHGPHGEPALSFELWCRKHNKYLGTGAFDSEVTLEAKQSTLIVVRVALTPSGAAHVLKPEPLGGHYDPISNRIKLLADLRDGRAYVAIYDVVVSVSFNVSGIYINEPLPAGAAAYSVNTGLQEVSHLHEGLPCLWPPKPLNGPLGFLRELLN
ncbi:MAG TPA: hypothetical protein ENF78_04485 [Candidatus Bathyarchaeota archaeon]|nr:hypothetical protein [Candidatus Bathyarchaeota archaeon]